MSTQTLAKPQASDIYRESVIFDALNVMAFTPQNVDNAIAAGVSGVHYTACRVRHEALEDALADIVKIRNIIDANPDKLTLAITGEDVRRAKREGKLAVVLGMQDPRPFRDNLTLLRVFRDVGVRIIQLTHNMQNYIGTGCLGVDGGLTKFGRSCIAEMNRLGIIPDISHSGERTCLDAIAASERPILCTHSNPTALIPSLRNKSDKVLEALAAKGGVVGIASFSPTLYRGNDKRPTVEDMIDCFDYAVKLVGPDHVGIGSDTCEGLIPSKEAWLHSTGAAFPEVTDHIGSWYGYETWFAEGMEGLPDMPGMASRLVARGYSAPDLKKIFAENFLKILDS